MDGAETLRNLRRNPETEKIPVIFLTTIGMFEEFDGLKSLGALAVIPKPFDPVRIGTQIQQILQGAQPASGDSTEESE
jgi:CheY-like chemotaxis protein